MVQLRKQQILSMTVKQQWKHLRGGVKKGAFDAEACQKKFDAWKAGKDQKLIAVKDATVKARKEAAAKELEAEN